MKKVDRRVLRTQQSLGDALVDLILENGYDAITIKQLTLRANIGYATFFRHFKSKDELLMFVLESVLSDLGELIDPETTSYEQALVLYQYIQRNCRIYRVFVSVPRDSNLSKTIYNLVETNTRKNYVAKDESRIPMEVAVNHIITSIVELVRWWLENDLKYSPEQMATIQTELIFNATETVALQRIEPGQ